MANSSLQGSREPLFCVWQEPRGLSTGITGDLALKYLHLPSKLQAFPRPPPPPAGQEGKHPAQRAEIVTRSPMCRRAAWPDRSSGRADNLKDINGGEKARC